MNSSTNNNYPIPMPPPVANTLMHLQSPNMQNSNRATLPSSSVDANEHIAATARHADAILQQPSSVINLSNSTDVVIGPMTQYQGAVTIYQYMDATVQRAENNNHRNMGNFWQIFLVYSVFPRTFAGCRIILRICVRFSTAKRKRMSTGDLVISASSYSRQICR